MRNLLICCLLLLPGALAAQGGGNPDILNYIARYKALAVEEMKRTGVPAAIKLAQGILETEAGKSDLVRRSNNHFGIKCKSNWTGDKVYHDDDARGECFRSYMSAEDSYRDHSDFLRTNQRYASLFSLDPTDYPGWAHGLKKAGYATNPRYPVLLIKTIEDYNLQLYTQVALGQAVDPDLILVKTEPAPDTRPEPVVKTPVAVVITPKAEVKTWPDGVFTINGTKVTYVPAGTSLLAFAKKHDITLPRLLEFNDMDDCDILERDQLIFLQRKRKTGSQEFHEVKVGETLYSISQEEGIRLESLLAFNDLQHWMQPEIGARLTLKRKNTERVALAGEKKARETLAYNTPSSAHSLRKAPEPEKAVVAGALYKNQLQHTVQPKETLYSIARKYGVSIDEIRQWNGLMGNDLKIGQQLIIQKSAYAQDSGTR